MYYSLFCLLHLMVLYDPLYLLVFQWDSFNILCYLGYLRFFHIIFLLFNKDSWVSRILCWPNCTCIRLLPCCHNAFSKVSSENAVSFCFTSDSFKRRAWALETGILRQESALRRTCNGVREAGSKQQWGFSLSLASTWLMGSSGAWLTPERCPTLRQRHKALCPCFSQLFATGGHVGIEGEA